MFTVYDAHDVDHEALIPRRSHKIKGCAGASCILQASFDPALALRRTIQRSAEFGDRLVAILIQLLELLLQRPELPGAFRRPLPVDVESVSRRRTRCLRPRHCPRRLVTTFGGSHLYALQIERLGGASLSLARWHDDFAARCVGWMPGQSRFGGERWTPAANERHDLVVLRTFCPRLGCNRQPSLPMSHLLLQR